MTYAVNHTLTVVIETAEPERPILAIRHAETDAALLALWLGRHASPHTQRSYARQAEAVLRHVGRPLGV
jgi:hypothetical protein